MKHHPDCDGLRVERLAVVVPAGTGYVLDSLAGDRLPGFYRTVGHAEAAIGMRIVDCEGECSAWGAAWEGR